MVKVAMGDGVRINVETEGREDGPPLVFSNSLATNFSMWDVQAKEAVGLGFRVIRYDQRGHGASDAPDGDYTLPRLAQDVIDLLDALGIETASFCGLSMGGMTGMHLGKRHPRRFTRIALANTAAAMPGREIWDGRIKSAAENGMAAIADGTIERWFTPAFRAEHPERVAPVRAMILATDPKGYGGCCAAIRDMDERDQLGLIDAPVLVIVGASDPSTPPQRGQYVVERIPGARKAVIESAHLSNIEQPEAFNRLLFGFLTGERA